MTVSGGDIQGPERPATPWLLRRANQRYRDAIRAGLGAGGFSDLHPQDWWAVDALSQGEQDATGLVAVMGITRQAVSKLVDGLVTSGYVTRSADARDRRRVRLALTTRGRGAARALDRILAGTDLELAAELGPGDLERVRAVLARLPGPVLPGAGDDRGEPSPRGGRSSLT